MLPVTLTEVLRWIAAGKDNPFAAGIAMAFGTRSQFALFVIVFCCVATLVSAAPPQSAREHYKRGSDLARERRFEQALEELKRASELDAKSPHIQNLLGVVLTQMGRLAEADAAYTRALSLDSGFYPARKNRAVNAYTQGNHEFAVREFDDLARTRPNDAIPRLFLGLDAIRRSDFPQALPHLLEAQRLAPENTQVLLALAQAQFALAERDGALDSARRFVKLGGTTGERFEMGALLAQYGAHHEAAEIFSHLWEEKPDSYPAGFNLALTLYRDERPTEALETSDRLLVATEPTGELLNLRGRILNKLGRFASARESFRRAIEAEPRNADHYLDLSTVLSNLGDEEAAMRVVMEGIARQAEKSRLLVQLGLLHQRRDRHEEAEESFRKAIEADPNNGTPLLALASLMASTSRRAEALALLAQAIESLPANPHLRCLYAGLLFEQTSDVTPQDEDLAEANLRAPSRPAHSIRGRTICLGSCFSAEGNLIRRGGISKWPSRSIQARSTPTTS